MSATVSLDGATFELPTELTSNGANQSQIDMWAIRVTGSLYLYYSPLLICLGSLGNLLSVFVFYTSKLRFQSTSQYLSALAISDTIFLLQLLPPWFSAAQLTSLFHIGGFCQFFVYISYVSCCLSAWLVVAFTIERFVAVIYPLRRNAMCPLTRARHVILGLTIASIVLNLPVLRFTNSTSDDCSIDRDYMASAARFNVIDTVISFTIPFVIIVILNSWIMVGVYRLERTRRQMMKEEQPTLVQRARCTRMLGCPRSQQKVTRMLLIVSSVFVILNLPAYTIRVVAYAYDLNTDEIGGRWTALQQISLLFFHTNFGINFILYCLTGQNFRRALIQCIPCTRRRPRRIVTFRLAASNPGRANSISMSYGSNSTEATSAVATIPYHRRRSEHFITKWTFDNTRQSQPGPSTTTRAEAIEMRELRGGI